MKFQQKFAPMLSLALNRYVAALGIVAAAAIVRLAGLRSLGTGAPYITFYPAVIFAALYGGMRAGFLATLFSALLADYFCLEPTGNLTVANSADRLSLALFAANGLVISWITESMHLARRRATAAEAQAGFAAERERAAQALRQSEERLNRTLRALNRSSQAMLRATDEIAYMNEVCMNICDCGHALVWIGMAENDPAKSVRPAAHAGFEAGYLDTLQITWTDTDMGRGPTGTAIRAGVPVLCQDMRTDAKFAPWRAEALKRGYASSLAFPLTDAGKAFGALTLYSRQPDAFPPDEMQLLSELAGDLAHGITMLRHAAARKQAEEALAQAKAAVERQNLELEQRVTERTAKLQQAMAEMERFAYVASHDLQEPLRAVSSFSQLLARRYHGRLDADADEFITYIVEAATRMQTLINDLLDLSRIGTRGSPFAPVACEEILQVAKENLELAIKESGAVITRDPLPALVADRTQLTQLFQNLLGNAIKFRQLETAPRIHVTAAREEGGWRLSVRDNGIGIDPQFFERIFIVFQRLHNRDEYHGTGIGLAICKKIVERHGGRLWVESQPGKGSTFHFTIPDGHEPLNP